MPPKFVTANVLEPSSGTRPKAEFALTACQHGKAIRRLFEGPRIAKWGEKRKTSLTLGELETLAGALLSVLLPFMLARIAREEPE